MKSEDTAKFLQIGALFPLDVPVNFIKEVNYHFNPEILDPWSSEVIVHTDSPLVKHISIGASIDSMKDHDKKINASDKDEFEKLLRIERQLTEDYFYLYIQPGEPDPSFDIILKRCALLINNAKCWEDLALKMYFILAVTEQDFAERHCQEIFKNYIMRYYSEASGRLYRLCNNLPDNIPPADLEAIAKMLFFINNKSMEIEEKYGDKRSIIDLKKFIDEQNEVLYKKGLHYFIPADYVPEIQQNTATDDLINTLFKGAQELLFSVSNNLYDFVRCKGERSDRAEYQASPVVRQKESNQYALAENSEETTNLLQRKSKRYTE